MVRFWLLRWAVFIVGMLACVLLGRCTSAATTRNVPSLEYPTIQAAIDAAVAGDTILVSPGTYIGPVNINKSLIVIGPGATIQAPTDFDTNSAYDYSLSTFNLERPIVHIGSASPINVTFQGFTIDGLRLGPSFTLGPKQQIAYSGILAEQCTVFVYLDTVRNILPADSGSTWDLNKVWNGRGIHVRGPSTAVIRANYLEQINRFYILVNATDDATPPSTFPTAQVDSNVIVGKGIYNGGQKGIWFNMGAWGTIDYNQISNLDYSFSDLEPERASGIVTRYGYVNRSARTVVHHNLLTVSSGINNKGMYIQSWRDSVADNSITGYRWGIEVHSGGEFGTSIPETVSVVRNYINASIVGIILANESTTGTADSVTIGGSSKNKNTIIIQTPPSQGGRAISLSFRDPNGSGLELRSPLPVNARYNDLGVYTSAEILDRLFQASDTTFSSGPPLDTVYFLPFWVPKVTANVKVFLQGPYLTTPADSMANALNTGGTLAAHFTGKAIPAYAVDSISIELRDSLRAAASTKRLFAPAWLLTNGTIRDFFDTAKSYVKLSDTVSGKYYCVVRHRNHLAVIDTSSLSYEGGQNPSPYDFSTSLGAAYGTNPMKFLGTRYVLWSGDANNSGAITASDRALWQSNNGTPGYIGADFNLSGQATASDRALWQANNGLASQVP